MSSVTLVRLTGVRCLALILLLAAAFPLHAQQSPGVEERPTPYSLMQRQAEEARLAQGLTALEGAVDPEEYVVGPGDQFLVSIGGAVPIKTEALVSADGSIALPDVGTVEAAGRTLEEVQSAAVRRLKEKYAHVPVSVSLVGLRHFYVHIAGAVPRSGRYSMLPISRVDDALQQAFAARAGAVPNPARHDKWFLAGSATSEIPTLDGSYQPALRKIKLTHQDGSVETLDLMRYYIAGDLESNPYLLDGDRLTVPAYHITHDAVIVTGDVPYAGRFAYRSGDTARDLLLLASGPEILETLDQVRLVRRDGEQPMTRTIDLADIAAGHAEPVPLRPGDLLEVVHEERATATVYGLVQYPGSYPIIEGETTLQELVEMAGGIEADADVRAASITRRKTRRAQPDSGAGQQSYVLQSWKQPYETIDLDHLAETNHAPIHLRDQDVVAFPRDEEMVFVAGNVPEPGYVSYVPGQSARYYLLQAGATDPLRTGVYVIDAATGRTQNGAEASVKAGATVFVNPTALGEAPPITQMAFDKREADRRAALTRTQIIISGLTATIGILATLDRFGLLGN